LNSTIYNEKKVHSGLKSISELEIYFKFYNFKNKMIFSPDLLGTGRSYGGAVRDGL